MNVKIGFFGDSFCAINDPAPKDWTEPWPFTTYIKLLENHYDAEIVNLGYGGSSIWDLFSVQLEPFINSQTIPDICIFTWTEPYRLFNRINRSITSSTNTETNDPVLCAARDYYVYLQDTEISDLQYKMALYYFDNVILPTFPATTKIIHLWSFGVPERFQYTARAAFLPDKIQYFHTWKTGIELRPPLMTIALEEESSFEDLTIAPNHLGGQEKNNKVFELIKNAIDNYPARKQCTG